MLGDFVGKAALVKHSNVIPSQAFTPFLTHLKLEGKFPYSRGCERMIIETILRIWLMSLKGISSSLGKLA